MLSRDFLTSPTLSASDQDLPPSAIPSFAPLKNQPTCLPLVAPAPGITGNYTLDKAAGNCDGVSFSGGAVGMGHVF